LALCTERNLYSRHDSQGRLHMTGFTRAGLKIVGLRSGTGNIHERKFRAWARSGQVVLGPAPGKTLKSGPCGFKILQSKWLSLKWGRGSGCFFTHGNYLYIPDWGARIQVFQNVRFNHTLSGAFVTTTLRLHMFGWRRWFGGQVWTDSKSIYGQLTGGDNPFCGWAGGWKQLTVEGQRVNEMLNMASYLCAPNELWGSVEGGTFCLWTRTLLGGVD
jgi:hypothetical protein